MQLKNSKNTQAYIVKIKANWQGV